jgi:hypothetical protein
MQKNIIYQGNSIISIETHPEYSHPVVIKKPSKRRPSRRSLRSLEKEYEMTRLLREADGLQTLMENFQFGRIRDLLGDVI